MSDPDGAMAAGGIDPEYLQSPSGDSPGGDPGDPDAMGADDSKTVDEGAGRPAPAEGEQQT